MKCQACEEGNHDECGMQTWCECDCAGPDAIGLPHPEDIVGHKTFDTGERDQNGLPIFRHEPLTRAEGDAMWERCKAAEAERAERMPDEQAAIKALFDAHQRLKELGWKEPQYCPKDGSSFKVIELGSTGIFDCHYQGEWPDGLYMVSDEHDVYPTSIGVAMFKDERPKKKIG